MVLSLKFELSKSILKQLIKHLCHTFLLLFRFKSKYGCPISSKITKLYFISNIIQLPRGYKIISNSVPLLNYPFNIVSTYINLSWMALYILSLFVIWCNNEALKNTALNPLSTRPHQYEVWYNHSWLGFLKIPELCTKRKRKILWKMSPHFSELNVAMAHRNYFRRNNLGILKLATYTKIEDHYFRCKLATF